MVLYHRKLEKYCFKMSFNEGMLVTRSSFLFYLHIWRIVALAIEFYIDSNFLGYMNIFSIGFLVLVLLLRSQLSI